MTPTGSRRTWAVVALVPIAIFKHLVDVGAILRDLDAFEARNAAG